MKVTITHDESGICVEVKYGKWIMILRIVGGILQKTAGSFIPRVHFNDMLKVGREAYKAHHCPDCPATPPKEEHHSAHFRKDDRPTPPNPRHWSERGDDD